MDWTLESYFPAFDGSEYRKFKQGLNAGFDALRARIDAVDAFEPATFAAWGAIVTGYEEVEKQLRHLTSYLECLTAADASDEGFQRERAAAAVLEAECAKIEVRLIAAIGGARHDHFEAFLKRDQLADAVFALRCWRERARHLMSSEEEELAAELEIDGLKAWSRLYDAISGALEFTLPQPPDGTVPERVPMSRRRALMSGPDRALRAAAFEGGNQAWSSVANVCAAALNAIAGARLTLQHRRDYGHFLDPALFAHRMSQESLEAMQEALTANAELVRALLRRKAARLGLPGIAWYDLEAPTPGLTPDDAEESARIPWEDGTAMVETAFNRTYPALGAHFRHMLDGRWIDHTPRAGKRPGGFCTHSMATGEQRIFMTFDGTINDVVTLAHEVGHAWHAHVLRTMRPLAQQVPMTLAESASTFAEMILIEGLLADPALVIGAKKQIIDSAVRQAVGFLLDVPMRFAFEHELHERRGEGELSISELKDLMVQAQRRVFGDSLASGAEDPLFWASKLHFYIADVPFYNFPYTVGYLLSRALFARFQSEGTEFLPAYETFLARTGSATCETLGREILGVDLREPSFWGEGIQSVAVLGEQFEALLAKSN